MTIPRAFLILAFVTGLIGLAACKTATPAAEDVAVSADKVAAPSDATAGSEEAGTEETGDSGTNRGAVAGGAAAEAAAESLDLADLSLPEGGGSVDQVLSVSTGQTLVAEVSGVSLGSVQLDLLGPEEDVLASSAEAPLRDRNNLRAAIAQGGRHVLRISSGKGAPALTFDLAVRVTGGSVDPAPDAAATGTGTGDADTGPADAAATGTGDADTGPADAVATGEGEDGGEIAGTVGTPAAPKRIAFQTGADGGRVKGRMTTAGEEQRYLLDASKDKVLSVTLTTDPAGAVDVMVFSPSGKPLRPLMPGGAQGPQRFTMPEDGDYVITLSAYTPADWTLELMLGDAQQSGAASNVPAGDAPTRVIFGPGNRATRLQGQVDGRRPQRYVLRGRAGDTLEVDLESYSSARPQIFVEDPRGQILASGLTLQAMTVPLPASQDYWVTVLVAPHSVVVPYAMNIGLQ